MLAQWICLAVMAAGPPTSLDPGMKIELFAEAPQIVTPTGIAVDGKGRVLAIESHTHFRPEGYPGPPADRIRRFEDTDGDGRAERIVTVFEGTKMTMAQAFGPDGGLFVATRNEIFLLDLDAEGIARAPRRTLVRLDTPGNYPHNGLSGVTFDFDGTLYFGLGENLGAKYALIGSDGTRLEGGGEGGNVYRCRRDGSGLERVATGFWNPFAMAFDAFGRLFAVDNDPDSRPPCRLLQIVDRGDYGYRFRNGRKGLHPFTSWNGELPGTLPMMAGTGEAPSGILAYESDALPPLRGTLLVTSWGDHRIDRFRPIENPANATLRASVAPLVTGGEDFRPVGIAAAPDGSILVTDWVDKSYELHGKGRIWRLSPVAAPRREPGSLGIRHPDRTVREAAARALANGGPGGASLLRDLIAAPAEDDRSKVSAAEALLNSGHDEEATRSAIARSNSPEVVRVAARRMSGNARAGFDWTPFLGDAATRAELLRRDPPGAALVGPAAKEDPFLSLALRHARASVKPVEERVRTFGTAPEESPLDALLILGDSGDPAARAVLPAAISHPDPDVRFAAVKWVGEARLAPYRADLSRALGVGRLTNALFEGTLAAMDLLDGGSPQGNDSTGGEALVARLVADDATPAPVRRRALRVLRPDHPSLTIARLDSLVRDPDFGVKREAIRSLRESTHPERGDRLVRLALDGREDPSVRAEAIAGISGRDDPERQALIALAGASDVAVSSQALRSLRGVPLSADGATRLAELQKTAPSPQPIADDAEARAALLDPAIAGREPDGDPRSGERIFFHPNGPGCYRCHRIEGRGGRIGPDLTATGPAMTRSRLIRSILEPDAEIAPQYTTWQVALHDGGRVEGVLVEEAVNGDQTYAGTDGKPVTVRGGDVAERRPLPTSAMPSDLAKWLTYREMLDLLAYIREGEGATDAERPSR